MVTPSRSSPPYEQFLLLPIPTPFKLFWERFLEDRVCVCVCVCVGGGGGGGVFSAVGGTQYCGGYHDAHGDIMMHMGMS